MDGIPAASQGRLADDRDSLFERLDRVLRLAGRLPPGGAGDDIRRRVCELIETNSAGTHHESLGSVFEIIASIQQRHAVCASHADDPAVVQELLDALRQLPPDLE